MLEFFSTHISDIVSPFLKLINFWWVVIAFGINVRLWSMVYTVLQHRLQLFLPLLFLLVFFFFYLSLVSLYHNFLPYQTFSLLWIFSNTGSCDSHLFFNWQISTYSLRPSFNSSNLIEAYPDFPPCLCLCFSLLCLPSLMSLALDTGSESRDHASFILGSQCLSLLLHTRCPLKTEHIAQWLN